MGVPASVSVGAAGGLPDLPREGRALGVVSRVGFGGRGIWHTMARLRRRFKPRAGARIAQKGRATSWRRALFFRGEETSALPAGCGAAAGRLSHVQGSAIACSPERHREAIADRQRQHVLVPVRRHRVRPSRSRAAAGRAARPRSCRGSGGSAHGPYGAEVAAAWRRRGGDVVDSTGTPVRHSRVVHSDVVSSLLRRFWLCIPRCGDPCEVTWTPARVRPG